MTLVLPNHFIETENNDDIFYVQYSSKNKDTTL